MCSGCQPKEELQTSGSVPKGPPDSAVDGTIVILVAYLLLLLVIATDGEKAILVAKRQAKVVSVNFIPLMIDTNLYIYVISFESVVTI